MSDGADHAESGARRLAVLGHPIAHSKSPALHRAAYGVLGLPWEYEAIDVTEQQLAHFVAGRTPEWRGLSLTMPLKRDVLPLLGSRGEFVDLANGANTVLFDDGVLRGFNTDVYGVTQSFRHHGVDRLDSVQLLGNGATASSVLIAVAELGARRVLVSARNPERAAHLVELGTRLGLTVEVGELADAAASAGTPDAVISTLPGGAAIELAFPAELRAASVFFDVAYDPWPTPLAQSWLAAGGRVISGLEMLAHQALLQVRIFVAGGPARQLHDEPVVFSAMRAAVGLDR